MNKKKQPDFDWNDITKVEKKIEVEPFQETKAQTLSNALLVEYNGFSCVANRASGGEKIAKASRIDADIVEAINSTCSGPFNAVMNELMRFALDELKKQGKTLIAK